MLKITGVILCILGCTGYGMLKISDWNKATEELEQWILLFEKMKSQIYYQRDVITEVCVQMEQKIYGLGGKYVAAVGSGLKEDRSKSFSQAWNKNMSVWDTQSNLPKDIKKMILSFPEYVGEQDYEQQISYLDFYLDRLKKEKDALEKQVQEKRKPVMAISLVSGITISILLF